MSDSLPFNDPYLAGFADTILTRTQAALRLETQLKQMSAGSLPSFADFHKTFGLHFCDNSWLFREWAPNASEMYILCDNSSWQKHPDFKLEKTDTGIFERRFDKHKFSHKDLFRLNITWPGGEGDRIPTTAFRVVQDPVTLIFNAQVWHPEKPYTWRAHSFTPPKQPLLIYEAHVGMALEDARIGTYREFEQFILPQIKDAGYTAIQLMAIQEHPYYGSFGYHVANFFAASSRFGTPDDLKSLIDAAHHSDIRVFMDIVHSHAVNNEVEGISNFDGTHFQFFHDGPKGYHRQWDSRCFNYHKTEVIHFLLSNLKFWMDEFKIDGFRFDGITSMIFNDHGLGRIFSTYHDYFGDDVDVDALSYLYLANQLVHKINPDCITIAEDVSGYPGLAAPVSEGGTGFDYRYAMGIADFWIKLIKDMRDEDWPMGRLWHELTTKRQEEKTISYAESHDQALVGDQTLMMRLMGANIYTEMKSDNKSIETIRGVALHKMIRLATIATAGSGYLNFMGNEFGHPEWIDFPSEQNHFSFQYARRQWSLKYNQDLYYAALFEFDRQMIATIKRYDLFNDTHATLLHVHEDNKILAFIRNHLIFILNFNPEQSFFEYMIDAPPGEYRLILDSDDPVFGGLDRLEKNQRYFTRFNLPGLKDRNLLSLYLPARTALVLKKV